MIGQSVAHYQVTSKLGAGGMGEVFRATDTRLNRQVALKVLPEVFAQDEECMRRFEREARILASLNHPNIASIHGLEQSDGRIILVMELVEGESLSERIARGSIALEEALPIVRQIAEALEYAHERGIVHRDLKPANVKLTDGDQAKVLDFGLAKALDPADTANGVANLSDSPTLTAQATAAGMILGTPAYMSPEQARGKNAGRYADVWALGCLVFEMLSGRQAFGAETISDALASVLRSEPDWTALPSEVGPRFRRILARCLEKDPRRRFHSAVDAATELESAAFRDAELDAIPEMMAPSPRWSWLPWSVAAVCFVIALAAVLLLWTRPKPGAGAPVTRFTLKIPPGQRLALPDEPNLAISRDGRRVVVDLSDEKTGISHLFLHEMGNLQGQFLAGTENATGPFFSPDGEWIGFFADGSLKKIAIRGGAATILTEAPQPRGGVWLRDGSIVFSPAYAAGLMKIEGTGGSPKALVKPDASRNERTYRWPDALPEDRGVLFTVGWMDSPQSYVDADIAVYDSAAGRTQTLLKRGTFARFVPPDRIIFLRDGILVSVPFDPQSLTIRGEPQPVLEKVGGDPTSGVAYLATAESGTFVFVPGSTPAYSTRLTLVDRSGRETVLALPKQNYHAPTFSPDGQSLAFNIGKGLVGRTDGDIWILGLDDLQLNRLTFDGMAISPAFSPDGTKIAYEVGNGDQAGLFVKRTDGSGAAVEIGSRSPEARIITSWSSDGRMIAYTAFNRPMPEVRLIDTSTGEDRLLASSADSAVFSPDGRYIAYAAVDNVFVQPIQGDGKWQVSPNGGEYPRWSANGHEIFYAHEGQLMRVAASTRPTFRSGRPEVLFGDLQRFSYRSNGASNYDVAPDGRHFIFPRYEDNLSSGEIVVTLNWAQQFPGDQ